jgi:asparagine synthase (glutamine-hydrolysing)
MNDFAGVLGTPDPAASLGALGVAPAWHDGRVAFGGAPVWTDRAGEIVVSGELVLDNAAELQAELELPAASPGELLAELYRRHGDDAGRRALGMFAVAVWDRRRERLTLLRDGAGARTLYHARRGGACWFAARLRTLRKCPAASRELRPDALRAYLTFAYVPGAMTLRCGVSELPPGTALRLPEEEARSFWEPAEGEWDPAEPLEAHAQRLRALLEDAVRRRLPRSGPVGVFLSGGLDSSLVAALAARDAPGPVHTYSVHFGAEHPHELEFSNLVAAHCGTRHRIVELPARRIRDSLPETMAALDDPIGDPLTVPNFLLGREAARDVGVILNGEGGDPCFGGPKNVPMLLHGLYHSYQPAEAPETAYLRSYQKCYDDLPRLLAPEVRRALEELPPPEALLAPFFSGSPMRFLLNRLMHVNVRFKGADQILTKVSNLSSANGLLGRSPLFDRRIVEASFAIPPEHKLAGADEKAVLKRAVADLLPEAILTRPKSGMLVPVQRWFRRELRRYAAGMLLSRSARTRPYLNREPVREWLAYRGSLWPRHGVKLWLLLTLEAWLRAQE